ncbi:MAG: glutamate 5-kinase [Vampirovibrionales bacterium]
MSTLTELTPHIEEIARNAHRIVVKLGTQVIVDASIKGTPQASMPPYYLLAVDRLRNLAAQLMQLKKVGKEVIVVSSGAVGLGRSVLGWLDKSLTLAEKQAAAAVGQPLLMHIWRELLSPLGIATAQVLLTDEDFTSRERYLNLEKTLTTLLSSGVIPILNENDTVHTAELKEDATTKSFGDNDRLSALVAAKLQADVLVILTQVPGLFTENPELNPDASAIPLVESFDSLQTVKMQGGSAFGRGGMGAKLEAIRIAAIAGVDTLLLSGLEANVITQVLLEQASPKGTLLLGHEHIRLNQKKQWIGYASGTQGVVILHEKAIEALYKGASLLPVGVLEVHGSFKAGAVISLQTQHHEELGRGQIKVSSHTLMRIKGLSSKEIHALTPLPDVKDLPEEVIHRDALVLFQASQPIT